MELTDEMKKLGLTQDSIYMPDLNTADIEETFYLSNPHTFWVPVKPVIAKTNSVDEYKEWMAYKPSNNPKAEKLLASSSFGEIPEVATNMENLSAEHFENLRCLTDAYVAGKVTLDANEKKKIETAFAPFKVAVYAINNLIIDGSRTVVISNGPVILFAGSVTFKYAPPRNGAFYITTTARLEIGKVTVL